MLRGLLSSSSLLSASLSADESESPDDASSSSSDDRFLDADDRFFFEEEDDDDERPVFVADRDDVACFLDVEDLLVDDDVARFDDFASPLLVASFFTDDDDRDVDDFGVSSLSDDSSDESSRFFDDDEERVTAFFDAITGAAGLTACSDSESDESMAADRLVDRDDMLILSRCRVDSDYTTCSSPSVYINMGTITLSIFSTLVRSVLLDDPIRTAPA